MKTLIPVTLILLLFSACKKSTEVPYQNQGAITGVDIFLCGFTSHCGGVKITIKNDPTPNPPAFYYVDTAITAFGLSLNSNFPVNVNLNWHHDPNYANYIIVDKLKLDN